MKADAPQAPITQEVKTGVLNVAQASQQSPANPQTPPPQAGESTPPPNPKKGLNTKKIVFTLILLPVLVIVAYLIFLVVSYLNCGKITPKVSLYFSSIVHLIFCMARLP